MSQSSTDPFDPSTDRNERPAGAQFSVTAAASPGVMPRALELFAKRGLVPIECRARADGGRLQIDIRIAGMEPRLADYIATCMRQIHLVDRVLVTPADSATDAA